MKITCRTCAENLYSKKGLNLFVEAQSVLLQQINILTNLWLENHVDLPNFICLRCQRDIKLAITFRERCISTQQNLKKNTFGYFSSSDNENDPLTIACEAKNILEYVEPTTANSTRPTMNSNDQQSDILQQEIEIKQEQIYVEPITATSTLPTMNSNEQQSDIVEQWIEIKPEHIDNSVDTYENTDIDSTGTVTNNSADESDYVPDSDEKSIPIRKEVKKLTECICELCGKHFNRTSNFRRHMMYHKGIKKFECVDCKARFYTGSQLKKHRRIHTNEKPYACQYCNRPFRTSTSKLKHERKHRNERPYKCKYCEKQFTTMGYLKNHHLTHTGIRNYHCDICSQSFLRLDHLKVHYKSQTHMKNMSRQNLNTEPI